MDPGSSIDRLQDFLCRAPEHQPRSIGPEWPAVYTDARGRFSLEDIPAWPARLFAHAPGLIPSSGDVEVLAPGSTVDRTFVLRRGAAGAHRRHLAARRPAAFHRENQGFMTDGEGRFICGGYRPGEEVFFGIRDLPGSPGISFRLPAGGPERTVIAPREAVLRCRLLLPDGSAPALFRYDLDSDTHIERDGILLSSTDSSSRVVPGGFEVCRLNPGKKRLAVRAEGAAPHFEELSLEEGEVRETEVRLRVGGAIRIAVPGAPPGLPGTLQGRARPKDAPRGIFEDYWSVTARLDGGAYVIRNAIPGADEVSLWFRTLGGIVVDRVDVPDGGAVDVEAKFVRSRD
jgi:hypothetical protein